MPRLTTLLESYVYNLQSYDSLPDFSHFICASVAEADCP